MPATIRTAVFVLAALAAAAYARADYLDADLRAQVEELKASRDAAPSSPATARDRARVLWRWLNAFALTGRHIPVNATQYVNSVLALDDGERVPPGLLKALDDLIREFAVRDADPDAIGSISISNQGPFIIDSWQTIEVTYTVGNLPIADGGVILVSRHFRDDGEAWQHTDPARDGYISIRASDPAVRFEPVTVPVRGMHGGFRAPQPQLAFRLAGGTLDRGETFTLTYGDTSGGGRGLQVHSYSTDAAPLPLYVDFAREDVFFSLPIATYRVAGKEPYAVHAFAPSIVGVNEPFDVSVRYEDEFYNRATGPMPALTVALNGRRYSTLPAGNDAIVLMSNVKLSEPGVYRFAFETGDGRITGTSDPIWVQQSPPMRIFWGETHGHCGFAEGQGSADSFFAFGRDDARLDFLTLSEHDIWMDDFEWNQLNDLSTRYNAPGKFVTFPGYEWTAQRDRGGHHNVFFRRTGLARVPNQEASTLADLYLALHAKYPPEDVLVIPHAHQAADWRSSDVYLERLVEIMSMHGTFEWFGDRYLEHGHEVGFIAASDDHLSHPGYSTGTRNSIGQRGGLAAVFARELTNDSVFDALRNRQAYATSGARMILDATMNGRPMGSRQPFSESRVLSGRVMGTAPIAEVAFIKNGGVIESVDYELTTFAPHAFVQVAFGSQSESIGRDNPRGYRPWRGSLKVTGATLKGVTTPGFQDRRGEFARIDEGMGSKFARAGEVDPNTVYFATATRGRINTMVLELDGAGPDTRIDIELRDGREYGTAPVQVRTPAAIPAESASFTLDQFANDPATHTFAVDRYVDGITLKLVNPRPALDREFEFTDRANPLEGDYYYLRIRQTDGALAWSSPFWVGGESPR